MNRVLFLCHTPSLEKASVSSSRSPWHRPTRVSPSSCRGTSVGTSLLARSTLRDFLDPRDSFLDASLRSD
jgi:hypothetical protein